MDCVAGVFREVDARILLLTFPKSSVMQIKQILVSVCSHLGEEQKKMVIFLF